MVNVDPLLETFPKFCSFLICKAFLTFSVNLVPSEHLPNPCCCLQHIPTVSPIPIFASTLPHACPLAQARLGTQILATTMKAWAEIPAHNQLESKVTQNNKSAERPQHNIKAPHSHLHQLIHFAFESEMVIITK